MKNHELANIFLTKASHDKYVLDRLVNDHDAPVEIFGFHAQQATEKALKAILSKKQIIYPKTHRLAELADLITDNNISLPEFVDELVSLTPYAVELRYDALPFEGDEKIDKSRVLDLVCQLINYASSLT